MTRPAANDALRPLLLLEDSALLVADKPAGVVVEPGLAHARDTLMNGLMATHGQRLSALGEARDWGLLHRLDRETSGCVLVALRPEAYDRLRRQFEERRVEKEYLAVVHGRPPRDRGVERTPLAEVRRGDMRVSVPARRGAGRPAVTRWRTLAAQRDRALLLVEIETGRLHQIRAHLAHLGCPIQGDRVYRVDLPPNTSRPPRGRGVPPLLLHAWRLRFEHPVTGRPVRVTSPPPAHLVEAAEAIGGRPLEALLATVPEDEPNRPAQ